MHSEYRSTYRWHEYHPRGKVTFQPRSGGGYPISSYRKKMLHKNYPITRLQFLHPSGVLPVREVSVSRYHGGTIRCLDFPKIVYIVYLSLIFWGSRNTLLPDCIFFSFCLINEENITKFKWMIRHNNKISLQSI